MELLQLRYFCELAKTEHLTKTANKLHISPPSLSVTISRLETELGVALFDRPGKMIRLNKTGREYFEYIEKALDLIDSATAQMEDYALRTLSELNISVNGIPNWYDVINSFRKSYPNVHVNYEICTLNETLYHSDLFKNTLYLGAEADIDTDFFDYKQLKKAENPKILISKNHPFARRKSLSLDELKAENFLTLGSNNLSCHKYLIDLCHIAGFEPEHVIECNYYFRTKLISEGKGIGISTDMGYITNTLENKLIKKIPLYGPCIQRTMIIAWKKDYVLPKVAHQFINYAVEYYKNT